jgi:hypothetical protein
MSTDTVLRRGMSTKRGTVRGSGEADGGKEIKWKRKRKRFGRFGLLFLNRKFHFFRYSIRIEFAIWQFRRRRSIDTKFYLYQRTILIFIIFITKE